jgi:hypothetical protein
MRNLKVIDRAMELPVVNDVAKYAESIRYSFLISYCIVKIRVPDPHGSNSVGLLDPDPHSECGSGSRRCKKS